jgi:hypothetical protein
MIEVLGPQVVRILGPIAGTHERRRGEPSQPDSDGPSHFPTLY